MSKHSTDFLFSLQTNICSLDAAGCDVNFTVTDNKQYFATEGYPNGYKVNQDCHFNFRAPSDRRFVVFFKDFHLEDKYDFIHFRELNSMGFFLNGA